MSEVKDPLREVVERKLRELFAPKNPLMEDPPQEDLEKIKLPVPPPRFPRWFRFYDTGPVGLYCDCGREAKYIRFDAADQSVLFIRSFGLSKGKFCEARMRLSDVLHYVNLGIAYKISKEEAESL